MLSRLPKLTPGYIRYLQTASVQKPADRMADFGMSRLAVLLGVLGVVVSGYSSRQLTLHHKPSARILHWGQTVAGHNRVERGSPKPSPAVQRRDTSRRNSLIYDSPARLDLSYRYVPLGGMNNSGI